VNNTECRVFAHYTLSLGPNASCNPSTHLCSCVTKDPGNVLTNPGFDNDTSGWKTASGSAVVFTGADAYACANSKAASINGFSSDGGIQQCAKLAGGPTFYFGAWFFQNPLGCSISYFNNPSCSGTNLSLDGFGDSLPDDGWGILKHTSTAPAGATYALVQCAQWDGMATDIDQIYLNGSNDSF